MIDEKYPEVETDEEDLIDLVDDQGRHLKFFHVGSTKYLNKWYAFFMPAEDIDGLGDEEVVIFEVSKDASGAEVLLPVDDHALLEQVFEQFAREMEEGADALEAEELEGGCGCGCGHHHEHSGCSCDDGDDCGCDCGCGGHCEEEVIEAEDLEGGCDCKNKKN